MHKYRSSWTWRLVRWRWFFLVEKFLFEEEGCSVGDLGWLWICPLKNCLWFLCGVCYYLFSLRPFSVRTSLIEDWLCAYTTAPKLKAWRTSRFLKKTGSSCFGGSGCSGDFRRSSIVVDFKRVYNSRFTMSWNCSSIFSTQALSIESAEKVSRVPERWLLVFFFMACPPEWKYRSTVLRVTFLISWECSNLWQPHACFTIIAAVENVTMVVWHSLGPRVPPV